MATISNVALSIVSGPTASTATITVTATMTFDGGDVGKSYRLEIKVLGEDLVGDNLPSTDSGADDELYTFHWGASFLKFPFRQFTVSSAGSTSFQETRTVSHDSLDEDSGEVSLGEPSHGTHILVPRKDEVYAKVTLSGAPTVARSPTVNVGFGV